MKVYISFKTTDAPHGGGNQFLKCLKNQFVKQGALTLDPRQADVILYNGHHEIQNTIALKNQFPNKKFIHRMDGLQKLYNEPDDIRQDSAINFNKISDGTIFQSHWSREKFKEYDFSPIKSTVIHNCADPEIFSLKQKKANDSKTRLLCTSWSKNINKGFNFYSLIDQSLDFNRFDFTFIGNKPENIHYKNIRCLPPKTTVEIADFFKKVDIFISATIHDCCSNSIIEALSSGVPVLAKNSGGNPELVKEGGATFNELEDFLSSLEKITSNIDFYSDNINIKDIRQVAQDYIEFFKCI